MWVSGVQHDSAILYISQCSAEEVHSSFPSPPSPIPPPTCPSTHIFFRSGLLNLSLSLVISPAIFLFSISSLSQLGSESIVPVISIPLVVHMCCMAPNFGSLSDCFMSARAECLYLIVEWSILPMVGDGVDGWCWSLHLCSHGTSASLGLSMREKRILNYPAVGMDSSLPTSSIFSFCFMYSDTLLLMHAH